MLATDDQGPIIHPTNEYDATILFHAELVRAPCILLDIIPLCFRDFSVIEKLVVTSNDDLWLSVEVPACEQATRVGGKVMLFVVPVLHPPGVDLSSTRKGERSFFDGKAPFPFASGLMRLQRGYQGLHFADSLGSVRRIVS